MSKLIAAISQAAAIRLRQRLQPEGGAGDKLFPPTFADPKPKKESDKKGVYSFEVRRLDGESVPCVLLDSVASQANRLEQVVADAVATGLALPELRVDFASNFPEIGEISVLSAPHRVFDAIFRDSVVDGKAFSKSSLYISLAAANIRNANAIFVNSPSALLFGCWDSAGAAGGLGNKFPRVITSELIGVNASIGETRGGVRNCPLSIVSTATAQIHKKATKTEKALDWSLASKATDMETLKPSEINHGNILVGTELTSRDLIDSNGKIEIEFSKQGGVTADYALQISVISINALKRLRFPEALGAASPTRDAAAQRVLLALGLLALTLGREQGYWLRSRCGLVAEGYADFEVVYGDGRIESFKLTAAEARIEFDSAVTAAKAAGLGWNGVQMLTPQPKLVELIKKSRELQALGKVES